MIIHFVLRYTFPPHPTQYLPYLLNYFSNQIKFFKVAGKYDFQLRLVQNNWSFVIGVHAIIIF